MELGWGGVAELGYVGYAEVEVDPERELLGGCEDIIRPLGRSADRGRLKSGQFSIEVDCWKTVLMISSHVQRPILRQRGGDYDVNVTKVGWVRMG